MQLTIIFLFLKNVYEYMEMGIMAHMGHQAINRADYCVMYTVQIHVILRWQLTRTTLDMIRQGHF